jgi:hypothetical protein
MVPSSTAPCFILGANGNHRHDPLVQCQGHLRAEYAGTLLFHEFLPKRHESYGLKYRCMHISRH